MKSIPVVVIAALAIIASTFFVVDFNLKKEDIPVPPIDEIPEEPEETCMPNWQCSPWSASVGNMRLRTCDDIYMCNDLRG